MLDLLFWLQWGLLVLLGVAALCAFGAAAMWCWATSVRYEDDAE